MAKHDHGGFDPYHKWLGIPKKRQPPTYYNLLGVSLNEEDAEVIRGAAEQRRRFVESKRGQGQDGAVAGVLYQIDEAEVTLLDPEMRRDYDRRLNLFHKRRRRRQVDPTAIRSRSESRPGKTVGEESGIVGTFAGVMAVLMVGFGLMAWFSFQLPWNNPPKAEKVADAVPRPAPNRPAPKQRPVEGKADAVANEAPEQPEAQTEPVADAEPATGDPAVPELVRIAEIDGYYPSAL